MKRKNRKNWHKLSKTEKVFQVGSNNFYINWNQKKNFFNKEVHAFNCYASSYNLQALNSFNPELQLKDTEYAIKNKLKRFSLN